VGSVVRIYPGPPRFLNKGYGELAQLGERLVCNQEVTGSIPVFSTSSFVGPRINEGFLTTEYSAIGSFLTTHSVVSSAQAGEKYQSSEVNTWSSY
jgi:hypothetical protein